MVWGPGYHGAILSHRDHSWLLERISPREGRMITRVWSLMGKGVVIVLWVWLSHNPLGWDGARSNSCPLKLQQHGKTEASSSYVDSEGTCIMVVGKALLLI